MLLLSIATYADGTKTCKVKGTDGSVEVSVMVTDAEKGECLVSFSNDTDRNVNVRYVITGTTTRGEISDRPDSVLVYANSESARKISFNTSVKETTVKVSTLTGEKCE